ncbi:MAG: alpha/beta hydrolase family protein [Saprospiraceae bacterium]
MTVKKDLVLTSKAGRDFLLDAYFPDNAVATPLVIFAHGFKGFKDWGCWHLIAEEFVIAGYAFVKFNFSHNGTTIDKPLDFADLEAFGKNNYTKELQDLDAVLNWASDSSNWPNPKAIDLHKLALIGHSRGGGISIIKAADDERIKALVTWASVAQLDYSWHKKEDQISEWKREGVLRALNGRTKQMMPLYYQLNENIINNKDAYSTELALQKRNNLPMLFLHGTADPAVPHSAAEQLKQWKPDASLILLEGANHVFRARHPWPEDAILESDSKELCERSISFLENRFNT